MPNEDERAQKKTQPEEESPSKEIFEVVVAMHITKDGKDVETKKIDFGKMGADQLKGLTDLFSIMASNVEYIRKLAPQYEKLDKSKPSYLH